MKIKLAGPSAKKYFEKLLPNQKFGTHLYGKKLDFESKIYDLMKNLSGFEKNYRKIKLVYPNGIKPELMTTAPNVLAFLQFLIKVKKASKVLEIGTFLGVSTMFFARAVKKNGYVVTIEKGKAFYEISKKNFIINKFKNIKIINGDVKIVLKKIKLNKFDFIFVDGNKANYFEIFKLIMNKVNKDCIICFDDTFYHGDIFNKNPKTSHGKGVKKLLNYLKKDKKWSKTLLPVSNGILLLNKIKKFYL